ncbi:thioesterase family protein [Novosphingobium sp.]|jgi:fluoroacetyl-CoA thioesterase|uniref:thioesterase family protein n=1 Tax=Novosphingobium sp. TaxID=1874826 RepID=UPI003FA5E314
MTSAPAATPLPIGLRHTESMLVMPRHTVPELGQGWTGFSDMPPVFATAMMIGFIEQTCIQGLRPYLTNAQRTVGTHVDVSHISATPVGRNRHGIDRTYRSGRQGAPLPCFL